MGLRLVVNGSSERSARPAAAEVRCSLATWNGEPGHCRWCDAEIDQVARGNVPWCSTTCQDADESNHQWAHARVATLVRDGEACTDCGRSPASVRELRLLLRALIPMDPVTASRLWHSEEWLSIELESSVDVAPRRPHHEGYLDGCHHHLDALVTRCRSCQDHARSAVDLRAG